MLEIGNGGMTDAEYRTHMSLWSLLAAPLLAGNDLRSASPEILSILTNREVIAIDQDKLGKQARRISKNGDLEIWSRPLARGDYAVGLFHRGASTDEISLHPGDIGVARIRRARDLWAHTSVSAAKPFPVASHGVVLLRVTP